MPEPAFHVGTCGYSYVDWRGAFYPQDLPQRDFLKYYSLMYDFVELDFSWYSMPKPSSLEAMAGQTGSSFLFSLKAHRSLTHEIAEDWPTRAEEFSAAAGALSRTGKLASVLIQLPYRFSYIPENRSYLADLCDALKAFPLVVEFRNETWYQPRVFAELERRGVSLAMIDRPDLPGLPPETRAMTTRTVYYRLHGRNAGQWWNGDATSRYDYEYSEQELKDRAYMLRSLSRGADNVFVAFNNHAKANAVRNARSMIAFIKSLLV